MAALRLSRLPPGPQGVAGAGDERGVRGRPSRHVDELHVHRGGLGVAGPLAVDEQLLDDAGQELDAGLPLPCADEDGAADLVEHGRRALFVRRVDDVALQGVDRRQFSSAVEAQLARLVGRRDGRGVGHVQRGQPRRQRRATRRGRQRAEQRAAASRRVAHRQVSAPPRGSP